MARANEECVDPANPWVQKAIKELRESWAEQFLGACGISLELYIKRNAACRARNLFLKENPDHPLYNDLLDLHAWVDKDHNKAWRLLCKALGMVPAPRPFTLKEA